MRWFRVASAVDSASMMSIAEKRHPTYLPCRVEQKRKSNHRQLKATLKRECFVQCQEKLFIKYFLKRKYLVHLYELNIASDNSRFQFNIIC